METPGQDPAEGGQQDEAQGGSPEPTPEPTPEAAPEPQGDPAGEQASEDAPASDQAEAAADAPEPGGPTDPASGQVHGGSSDAPVAPDEPVAAAEGDDSGQGQE